MRKGIIKFKTGPHIHEQEIHKQGLLKWICRNVPSNISNDCHCLEDMREMIKVRLFCCP